MRKFETLIPDDLKRYRERSEMAINGINLLMQVPNVLKNITVEEKYSKIATCLGLLDSENCNFKYFVPLNKDIVFLLCFTNDKNVDEKSFEKFELMGAPDARYVICTIDRDDLVSNENIYFFLLDLQNLFKNGELDIRKKDSHI